MISSEAEDREQRAVSPVALLSAIQRKTMSVEDQRKHWLNEIDGLARLIGKLGGEAEGITYGALGGLQYAISQLQLNYECRPLEALEEAYAEDELLSYATSREEVDQTVQRFGRPGMDIRVDTIRLETGHVFYRVYLGTDYLDTDKRRYPAGTMLACTRREFPPLSQVHQRI